MGGHRGHGDGSFWGRGERRERERDLWTWTCMYMTILYMHGHTCIRQVCTCIRVCGCKGIHAYGKYVHAWELSMGSGGSGIVGPTY